MLAHVLRAKVLAGYRVALEFTDGSYGVVDFEPLLKDCNAQVQAAAQAYIDTPGPSPEQMFDQLYASLPNAYARQRDAVLQSGHGPDNAG